ncbi:hypothetical protein J3Q64DRAFT_1667575 [Phycomyces blakesleeanus]|uniref:Uncharacterized protein n=2 Tax=Phycomyces blakesleeanus TaxID=4837 RepID=A0A167N403_PHYB8|nr:hypothetical protein PHYBLDRAFT_180973 [Phycomyces blakesleeanus NRRL 1555(-)]OAD74914.1 hypothetical protein PHYBLDRAFT_180973 [Phycomyces blakesleeanus NRRL 1555(-)]|eukprot:XP_018292954.1 hypothetical protein PHYBLDRAFT_180973 [Phycomyces blakesleeanus NRRL 1555(-)]
MPSVDELKEAFAFAGKDIKAREKAVEHYALRDSEDWYYYSGLIILQRLADEVNSKDNKDPRDPTAEERELMNCFHKHLTGYEAKLKLRTSNAKYDNRYKALQSRYYVLVYLLDKKESTQFLQDALNLDKIPAIHDEDQDNQSTDAQIQKILPSTFSQKIINSEELVWKSISQIAKDGDSLDVEYLALPVLSRLIKKPLSSSQESVIFAKLLSFPQASQPLGGQGIDFTEFICKYLSGKDEKYFKDNLPGISLDNLTIDQMDIIRKSVPLVVLCESFLTTYIKKLVPLEYLNEGYTKATDNFWDDENRILEGYLSRLWTFVEDLPVLYQPLKALIGFHKLRLQISRENFSEAYLLKYLALTQGRILENVMSPVPGRPVDLKQRLSKATTIKIPYLTNYATDSREEKTTVYVYLTGVLTENPDMSLDPILKYLDLNDTLKKLYTTVQLTHPLRQGVSLESSNSLTTYELDKLINEVKLEFAPSTINIGRILLADTPIKLSLQLKQVGHLTVRVYPIDLYNYWRMHSNKRVLSMSKEESARLDGLCPLWEDTIDFTKKTALCTWKESFVFGKDHLASDCVQGRGAWIIDFVGENIQCRAIVQRGHLRHLVQDTSAGHLIQIIDENNIPLKQDGRIWYADSYYESDANGNILIPYRAGETKNTEILLLSKDGFCEPVAFTHKTETYDLTAKFYVNLESVLTNRQAKMVGIPRLTIHEQPASLDLLEKMTLTVTATSLNGVKSSTTSQYAPLTNNSFDYEFTVPDLLNTLELKLTAKVKSTSTQSDGQEVEVSKVLEMRAEDNPLPKPYLRINKNNEYYICSLGKNGEIYKNKEYTIKLEHSMIRAPIVTNMQTDEHGIIHLGPLENIHSISVGSPELLEINWDILKKSNAVLPTTFNGTANTPLMFPFAEEANRMCSIYQTDGSSQVLHDFTNRLSYENGYLKIAGLPEGRFTLYLYSQGTKYTVTIWIFNSQVSTALAACGSHWSNWILSYSFYATNSRWFAHSPLVISDTTVTDQSIVVSLNGWSKGKTYALVTTTAFIETRKSLTKSLLTLPTTSPKKYASVLDTRAVFITGCKLSDEYQYILKRARAEKWVGSSLVKPSLLLYPEALASATSDYCVVNEREHMFAGGGYRYTDTTDSIITSGVSRGKNRRPTDYGFLDHRYSILRLEPDEDGKLIIDRAHLGDGNILQLAVLSGEQIVTKEMVLDSTTTELRLKNRSQTIEDSKSEQAYVRIKSVSTLYPENLDSAIQDDPAAHASLQLDGGEQEFEVVDSFEKLFNLFKVLSNAEINTSLEKFKFLLTWPSLSLKKKLDHYNTNVCHELNLWLKHKDVSFFEHNVKPFIKSKVTTSFMDLYLVDEDLNEYADSLYLYNNLNMIEKAFLAKRVPGHFDSILRSFEDASTAPNEASEDIGFDTVMSSNALNQQPAQGEIQKSSMNYFLRSAIPQSAMFASAPMMGAALGKGGARRDRKILPQDESDDDMGFADDFYDNPSNTVVEEYAVVRETVVEENDDDQIQDDKKKLDEDALRARSAKQQIKVPYSFVKPTKEWEEKGYYNGLPSFGQSNNSFWVDYIKSTRAVFLSKNFLVAINNFTEIMAALSVMDLPYAVDAQWKCKSDSNSGALSIISAKPCLVFHRTLKATNSIAPTNPIVLLGQGIFNKSAQHSSREDITMINPTDLTAATEYSWHLVVSNISSKSFTCEATLQIPSGAVPIEGTPYCQSKFIALRPYSTWESVIGSFYFPHAGNFTQLPITITDSSKLLNKSQPISLSVSEPGLFINQKLGTSNIPWSVVASKMKNEDVLDYLSQYKKLDELNFGLITWRMSNKAFARKVFDVLGGQRRYHTGILWQYGLTHGFLDIIRQLIQIYADGGIIPHIGKAFVSPLLCTSILTKDTINVLDYYPIISARAHSLGTKVEILNTRFSSQYNDFLGYLCDKSAPSTSDLLVLGVYLLLQDRIGESHRVYNRILQELSGKIKIPGATTPESNVQLDYLGAYLQTRLLESQVSQNPESVDLNGVRKIAQKYRTCGNLRWRALFASLEDFVDEVDGMTSSEDRTGSNITSERRQERALHTEPVLDMEVNEKDGLVVHYANMTDLQVNYYKTNVEVVFSGSPFMANEAKQSGCQQGSGHSLEYGWVKPNYTENYTLESNDDCVMKEVQGDEDFDMIGVNRIKMKTKIIPLPQHLISTNVMVEVTGSGLRRSQTFFAHQLTVHIVEPFGVVRVAQKQTKRPLAGVYVKVYCRSNGKKEAKFWKDGYTGLNGVFDYVSVTEGNELVGTDRASSGQESLSDLIKKINRFSILISSEKDGSVVKEAYPPS